jgi:glutathione S-transferase
MSLTLYAHPFSAYSWKVLIALYENSTPFEFRILDDAAAWADLESLWPMKKFPLLRDGDTTVVESSIIVEYLMNRYPATTRMLPSDVDAALNVRFLDRFFDNYIMSPMQTLVADRMRPPAERDVSGSYFSSPANCVRARIRGHSDLL